MQRFFHENFERPLSEFEKGAWYNLIIAPRDEQTGTYHVHFGWMLSDEAIEFRVGYYPDAAEHAPDEREPFAEDVMGWLGKFVKYDSAQAIMHGSFTYPLAERQSRVALAVKIGLGPTEAEIDGISLNLAHKPDGVSAIRLTQGRTNWFVDALGETRIVFKAFSPHEGPSVMARVVSTILEERAP